MSDIWVADLALQNVHPVLQVHYVCKTSLVPQIGFLISIASDHIA